MTRYEKIKNMSIEEMAKNLDTINSGNIVVEGYCGGVCPNKKKCEDIGDCVNYNNVDELIWWLNQKVD